jgi:hypothetical protein
MARRGDESGTDVVSMMQFDVRGAYFADAFVAVMAFSIGSREQICEQVVPEHRVTGGSQWG